MFGGHSQPKQNAVLRPNLYTVCVCVFDSFVLLNLGVTLPSDVIVESKLLPRC